jgi:hypothetical protein
MRLSHDRPDTCCRCPITQELFVEPVVAMDGHTYDRESIGKWYKMGHRTSPLTGEKLKNLLLIPNHNLRSQIAAFRERFRDLLQANSTGPESSA